MLPLLIDAESSVRVIQLHSPKEAEALISLFEEIAQEQEWCSGDQLRAHGETSVFFVLEIGGQVIGGLQIVLGHISPALPCLTVWPELGLSGRSDIADVALLALQKEVRGTLHLYWLLCIELWRYCRTQQITELWAEVPPRNLRLYRRLGWPFEVMGELRPHWGEDCYPCRAEVAAIEQAIIEKSRRSAGYAEIVRQACCDLSPEIMALLQREYGIATE